MSSEKSAVFEILFFERWDSETKRLKNDVVTLPDVENAIRQSNVKRGTTLSSRNPANFIKDFLRSRNRNENWPGSIAQLGYSAVQETGGGTVFRFIPYGPEQTTPFPEDFVWAADARRIAVQSVTLPLAARKIRRLDEARLMQIVVALRIMETHFSVVSTVDVMQLEHIQNNMKLNRSEIDGLFQANYKNAAGENRLAIITVEAKQEREPVHASQVLAQVREAGGLPIDGDIIVPTIVKAGTGGVHIMEFESIPRAGASEITTLAKSVEAFYEVLPDLSALHGSRGSDRE